MRVILVGRTGLDAKLRLDPKVELVRVRSAIEAVGEVADPYGMNPADRTVVIVAPDAEPATSEDGVGDHAAEFLAAIRSIDPKVRVLRVRGAGATAESLGIYDGTLRADMGSESLRAVIRGDESPRPQDKSSSSTGAPRITPTPGGLGPGANIAGPHFSGGGVKLGRPDVTPAPTDALMASVEKSSGTVRNVPNGGAGQTRTPSSGPSASGAPRAAAAGSPGSASSHADDLRSAARGFGTFAEPMVTSAPEARQTPAPPAPPAPPAAREVTAEVGSLLESAPLRDVSDRNADDIGDAMLIRQLVRGRDPLVSALALINERVAPGVVEYTAFEPGETPTPSADQSIAIVAWERQVYGSLRARGVSAPALEAHARWLAGWLRLRDQQTQLRDAAFTDTCTGAYNRRFCERFLATAIEQARAARRNVTVLYFDVDNFKGFNDRYGHAAGDDILCEVVRLLQASVRPADRVCRVGGDEFVVIFHEPDGPRLPDSKHPTSVFQIAARFQKQIQERRFPKLGLHAPGSLTISGGLATFPWDGSTAQELIDRADQLALESKRQGKNVITIGPGAATGGRQEQPGDG